MRILIVICVFGLFNVQCESNAKINQETQIAPMLEAAEIINEFQPIDSDFDRSTNLRRLANKIDNKDPLIVHLYVPLCDNEHQGIVPTSASLGDGLSLRTNLYWATSGGTKAYFSKQPDWNL